MAWGNPELNLKCVHSFLALLESSQPIFFRDTFKIIMNCCINLFLRRKLLPRNFFKPKKSQKLFIATRWITLNIRCPGFFGRLIDFLPAVLVSYTRFCCPCSFHALSVAVTMQLGFLNSLRGWCVGCPKVIIPVKLFWAVAYAHFLISKEFMYTKHAFFRNLQ